MHEGSRHFDNCSEERIKQVAVVEQKVVEARTFVPRVIEVVKIVERLVPVESVVEKIVEVPVVVEKIVERQVDILRIVEEVKCCCASDSCYNGRLERLVEEVSQAQSRLHKVQTSCLEECELLRQRVAELEQHNYQLTMHIEELQNSLRQLREIDSRKNTSMEISVTDQAMIATSSCTIKTYDLTTSRNSHGQKDELKSIPYNHSQIDELSESNLIASRTADDQKPLADTQSPRIECSLREFVMGQKCTDQILLLLMIKLTEQVQRTSSRKHHHKFYRPDYVRIGFDHATNLQIILNPAKGLDVELEENRQFVAPEIKSSQMPTDRSCVYNLGVIWKELMDIQKGENIPKENLHPLISRSISSMLSQQPKGRPSLNECLHLMKATLSILNNQSQLSLTSP